MGVAVRKYIDILIITITFPYSTCISYFFGSTSLFIFKIQAPPAKTMSRSIIIHTSLSLRILHSLEHSHFMGGSLAEYLGISLDVHTFFAVMHLLLVSIGNTYSFFDKLVCRILKERLSTCHVATVTEIILISVSSMLCTNLAA